MLTRDKPATVSKWGQWTTVSKFQQDLQITLLLIICASAYPTHDISLSLQPGIHDIHMRYHLKTILFLLIFYQACSIRVNWATGGSFRKTEHIRICCRLESYNHQAQSTELPELCKLLEAVWSTWMLYAQ